MTTLKSARIGLVLGGGGLTGRSYHAGVLAALADAGWDARDAAVFLGTSAGAITASSLAAGLPPADLKHRLLGQPLSKQGQKLVDRVSPGTRADYEPTERTRGPASPSGMRRIALDPGRLRAGALTAVALPRGRVPTVSISRGVDELCDGEWPSKRLGVTAVRLRDAEPVVFSARTDDAPPVGAAVAASCAVPGYFQPVAWQGEEYVDGGARTACNADLLRDFDLDVVLVAAPMAAASVVTPSKDGPWRQAVRHQLQREVKRLRKAGKLTFVFAPGRAEVRAMGINPMARDRDEAAVAASYDATMERLARDDELTSALRV